MIHAGWYVKIWWFLHRKYSHFFFFYTVLIPFRKFGPPYPGKATAAARAVLPSPASACCVFHVSVIHQTLTCMIFNMRKWSFLCSTFDSEKLIKFFLRSWWDSNLGHDAWDMNLSPMLYQLSHPKLSSVDEHTICIKDWDCNASSVLQPYSFKSLTPLLLGLETWHQNEDL